MVSKNKNARAFYNLNPHKHPMIFNEIEKKCCHWLIELVIKSAEGSIRKKHALSILQSFQSKYSKGQSSNNL